MPVEFRYSRRWLVVAGACVTQALVIGGVFSYSVFFTVFEQEFGWSRTLLSASSSLSFMVMGLMAVVVGRLNDSIGPRWVLSVTGTVCGLGFILMSYMQAPWQLLVFFGLFVGIGLSAHDVSTLSTIAMWFERKRGIVTGLVKTGTACGQVVMPMLATALLALVGWRSALFWLGVALCIGLFTAAQLMRRPKAGTAPSRSNQSKNEGLEYSQAKRSIPFMLLCAIQFCFFPTLITIPLHIVAHAKDTGMTTQSAATVLSTIGAASILGRLCVGFLFDVVGGKLTMICALALLAISLFALLLIDLPVWLYLFAVIYGIAHGGLFTVVSPTVAEFFGMRAHGALFGTIVLFGTVGAAAGPVLAGLSFDRTGSYTIAIQVLIALVVLALILATRLRPLLVAVKST